MNEPIAWVESATLARNNETVRVMFDSRKGNKLFVRQVDPGDGEPPRVPLHEGDELVLLEALSHVSLHTTGEVGRTDDFMFALRVVPDRREGNDVYMRTLRYGEVDNGARVHVRPGDNLRLEAGAMQVALDQLDDIERNANPDRNFVPLSPVLLTWLSLGEHDPNAVRYLLAAARRLDTARALLDKVEILRSAEPDGAPAVRRVALELVGTVEAMVVSLGRVSHMVHKAKDSLGSQVPVPPMTASKAVAIKNIRDAYEHIEERAFGKVFKSSDPDALTIFDYEELFRHDRVVYGSDSLDLASEVPVVIDEIRQFLKDIASNS